jgi:signal transduction histidine kinase
MQAYEGSTTRHREDRRLAGRLIRAQEEERRQLGRELHDDLSQRLANLVVEAQLLGRAFSKGHGERAVRSLVHQLETLSEDVRRLSHRLHPATLERLGLVAALEAHATELEKGEDLRVRLTVQDGGEPLPTDIACCLYRVAQEALRNAARHSGAETARLTLTWEDGEVRLVVADSGVGFEPARRRNGAGLGLASMEERARLLGGRLEIRSTPGTGTEIEAVLPLD